MRKPFVRARDEQATRTMAAAESFKAAEAETSRYHELIAQSDQLREEMHRLRSEAGRHWQNAVRLREGAPKSIGASSHCRVRTKAVEGSSQLPTSAAL